MNLTIPTLLTLARIVMIPVMAIVFYLPGGEGRFWAGVIFVAGALTDWLDGWIARRWQMGSAFGAFLDPVADKLAVTAALFIVVQSHPTVWLTLLAAIIVGREITISALREWMAGVGARGAVGAERRARAPPQPRRRLPQTRHHGTGNRSLLADAPRILLQPPPHRPHQTQ